MSGAQGIAAGCHLVVNYKIEVVASSEARWVIVLRARIIVCEVHIRDVVSC